MQADESTIRMLRLALEHGESVIAVHYACESFFTAKGHPPSVASLATYDLQGGDVLAFSRADCPDECADPRDCEIDVLRRFYAELSTQQEAHFLHWNMSRPEFGFSALATRWRYLTSDEVPTAPPRSRHDVDSLLAARFGEDYAPHGKLESTAHLNDMDMRSFRSGKEEAAAFEGKDWSTLTRSSASKAKIVGELFRLLAANTIKTAGSAGQVVFADVRVDAVACVLAIAERFRLVQRSLSKHPHGGSSVPFRNEYDDQFLMRALLVQFFDDVREEEFVPSYAGSNSRIDFVLSEFRLAVELKHTRPDMKDAALGKELLEDREHYGKHPDVTHLIALVFDYDGRLRNPRGLEKDLRREHSHPDLTVTVRILDR